MRVLFIGGTGNISIAATRLCAEQGVELTLLNRGQREIALPKGVRQIQADIRDRAAAAAALDGEKFDAVVDWVAFVPDHVETDIALFAGKISHYVFISSATGTSGPRPSSRPSSRRRSGTCTGNTPATRSPARTGCAASAPETASRLRSCARPTPTAQPDCRPRSMARTTRSSSVSAAARRSSCPATVSRSGR